jgi:hypothetical protein
MQLIQKVQRQKHYLIESLKQRLIRMMRIQWRKHCLIEIEK